MALPDCEATRQPARSRDVAAHHRVASCGDRHLPPRDRPVVEQQHRQPCRRQLGPTRHTHGHRPKTTQPGWHVERGGETSPRRVDHEALWGMLRLGRGEAYRATRVWPLWNAEEEADAWSWSLLGGLLGRRGDADAARWRYLWFFGGEAPNTKALGKEDAP